MKLTLSDYEVSFGDAAQLLSDFLCQQSFSSVAVLADENTARDCLPKLAPLLSDFSASTIVIPSGERHKNIQTCEEIWQKMIATSLDRHSLLLNVGGGVVGDMGGFCAATFKRGMAFVQIPTTLLAQVDASVGGKLGIDFGGVKNAVGVFQSPRAVVIDVDFLHTLPQRELRSGFAEIVKHTLIADKNSWNELQMLENITVEGLQKYILPSLLIKKNIVEADPFERNIRKALNFGHTVGHALESYFLAGESPLLHGEAVAAGMVVEARLSHRLCGLHAQELAAIEAFISKIFPGIKVVEQDFTPLLALMQQDKKNEQLAINFSLIAAIGQPSINQTCTEADLKWAMLSP